MTDSQTLPGVPVDPSVLGGLKQKEVLVRSDFPLLVLAEGPAILPKSVRRKASARASYPPSKWLLSWCDWAEPVAEGVPGKTTNSVYMAVRMSEGRLAQFLDNHVSLREAVLHCEFELYLTRGPSPTKTLEVTSLNPTSLPESYLPSRDFALNGSEIFNLDQAGFEAPVRSGFHLITPGRDGSQISWNTTGPFQTAFQKYLSWAAHFIRRGHSPKGFSFKESDWSALNTRRETAGSYTIFCAWNTTDERDSASVDRALSELKSVVEQTDEKQLTFDGVTERVGVDAANDLYSLLSSVSQLGIAVTVRWQIDGKNSDLALNKRVAEAVMPVLRRTRLRSEGSATLTITFTKGEADYLLRKVTGTGGWQSSLRKIQSKIDGNKLTLTADEVDQIVKQAQSYGQGGFQDRLQMVIRAIRRWEASFSGIQ